MAESRTAEEREPGAPIAPGSIDPELVKLSRTKLKIGVITAAGIVVLCAFFLVKLGGDREYASSGDTPKPIAVGDVTAGAVDTNSYVHVDAEPLMSHALRVGKSKSEIGLRAVPVRGTNDRFWIVLDGDGWVAPATKGYDGRIQRLSDLPFARDLSGYAEEHPRPLFATAQAVRGGFGTGKLTAVSGDPIEIVDGDRVAFDVLVPDACTIVASFNDRLPTIAAWTAALARAGVTPTKTSDPDPQARTARFDVPLSVADATAKLAAAELFAVHFETVTRHYETTWGALKASPAGAFVVDKATSIPDNQIEVVGLYTKRTIPSDAYVLITGDVPSDYWYVMPITLALVAIGFVFAWALVRAVRRDLLPARA